MFSATISGTAEPLQLEHEPQIEPQVRGVDDAHEQIRRRLARVLAEHDVARDRFIERRGLEAVRAGQIEHAIGASRTSAP